MLKRGKWLNANLENQKSVKLSWYLVLSLITGFAFIAYEIFHKSTTNTSVVFDKTIELDNYRTVVELS